MEILEKDWRLETLEKLRAYIREDHPDLIEMVVEGVLGYGKHDDKAFYLHVQKQHVGVYVGDAARIDTDGSLLDGLDVGKGCVRIRKSVDVDKSEIREFISRTVAMWKSGVVTTC